ncbi:YcbK family protein [Noviherbaspirillum malthae]|uniref:YcbK family protein n=1 Tax=Noviherbaspirillum malthae TaxID=1260987 RepID=UPI00188FFE2B|nr:DUF882 domain-containing protein [Noviherbaspirillum malthae]
MSLLQIAPDSEDLLAPSRRRFLLAAAGAVASVTYPSLGIATDFWSQPRELWLTRPATGESVREVYWADGQLVLPGYYRICQLLRDVRINQAVQFDIITLDIARGIYGWLQSFGINRPIIVNSGYRHPSTNAGIEGAARSSLHTRAQALDVRIEGVSSESVARFGLYLAGGGVGFYPGKNFTHVDRGRVRYWRG